MSRFSRFVCGAALACMVAPVAFAASRPESVIKGHFKTYLGQEPDEVRKTEYGNLYEVRMGTDIVYSDPAGLYLIAGNVIDLRTKKNLTEERTDQISKIDFKSLPKNLAIKIVKGNGSAEMAVFSDPNCGHCQFLEKQLKNVMDVTIYLYPMTILGDKSKTVAENTWCSADPAKSWNNWMLGKVNPVRADYKCALPDKEIKALADKLGIHGTPTIFFSDGTRVPGAIETQDINFKLKMLR